MHGNSVAGLAGNSWSGYRALLLAERIRGDAPVSTQVAAWVAKRISRVIVIDALY
jgi:hypothetical protein